MGYRGVSGVKMRLSIELSDPVTPGKVCPANGHMSTSVPSLWAMMAWPLVS